MAIRVLRDRAGDRPRAVVTFSGGGAPDRVVTFMYRSPFLHPVEFEFDCAEGTTAVLSVDTHAHPNRPSDHDLSLWCSEQAEVLPAVAVLDHAEALGR